VSPNPYPLHQSSEVDVSVTSAVLFAALDDHKRLASHMVKPSLMTAGASMRITTDARHGQAVGSVISMSGQVLGLKLTLDEVVTERQPPFKKAWETRGQPRLLVIAGYHMGFTISPRQGGSHLVVFIDYGLPEHGLARWLGKLFGKAYAGWCTRRMASDAARVSASHNGAAT
jgi:hypothetical protein